MKITVDRGKCRGVRSCASIAPATFDIDEQFKAVLLDPRSDGDAEIIKAAKFCSALAILPDDETTAKRNFP